MNIFTPFPHLFSFHQCPGQKVLAALFRNLSLVICVICMFSSLSMNFSYFYLSFTLFCSPRYLCPGQKVHADLFRNSCPGF